VIVFFLRATSRPWAADLVFKEVYDTLVSDKNSLLRRVEHSKDFKEQFGKFVAEWDGIIGTLIKNLRAAKHRFEKEAMPTGRFTIYLDPLIATANWISAHRTGQTCAKDSDQFMLYLSGKRVLIMGALSDAAHEGLIFVRFSDDKDLDLSAAPHHCASFVHRLHILFVEGKASTLAGFAKYALDMMKRSRNMYIKGHCKTLGGPGAITAGDIRNVMQRMCCFVKLAIAVVETEFPHWNVLQCFIIFGLAGERRKSCEQGSDNDYKLADEVSAFSRLAQFFDLDVGELRAQHADILPLAQHIFFIDWLHKSGGMGASVC